MINNLRKEEMKRTIKPAQCLRLEELEEASELVITEMKEISYMNKARYILQFDHLGGFYLSNYWLQREIQDSNKDLNYKIKVKVDGIKTTPTKHNERLVYYFISMFFYVY